jgi:hypothetical protein
LLACSLGANNSIQHAAVRHILDTVVEELVKDPARKFIYVEQAFFQLWHDRQTEKVRNQVQNLVATGQLEFVNGGWCMHDEANTHFIDMIDQTTLGHQYILKQFGKQPKVSLCFAYADRIIRAHWLSLCAVWPAHCAMLHGFALKTSSGRIFFSQRPKDVGWS